VGFVQHRHPFTPYDRAPDASADGFRAMPIRDDMLPPAPEGEFRHRVGVKPLDLAEWLPSDEETGPTIAMKRALIAERRDEVVACTGALITGEFRRRFLSLGWRGAAIGGGGAIGFFALAQLLSSQSHAGAGADQMQAMFGDFALGLAGYGLILALVAGVAWLTAWLCQRTVFQYLKDINS